MYLVSAVRPTSTFPVSIAPVKILVGFGPGLHWGGLIIHGPLADYVIFLAEEVVWVVLLVVFSW